MNENLIPMSERSKEEASELGRKGGIASGETRRKKATLKKTLETLLEMTNKETGQTYQEEVTIGLIKGAKLGKAENYKLIAQMLGEMQEDTVKETPSVEIKVIDNSNLEKVLYEEKDI